jgi:phosphoglycolate phosphatase
MSESDGGGRAAGAPPVAALPEYDCWLFDLDGTLVDVEWSYARATLDAVGERLGRSFTDREVATLWHGFGGPRNDRLRSWGIDPDAFWPALHAAEEPAARARATRLHDDAGFVADLDAPTGLVTHCQPFLADPVLDRLGLRDWFDVVVCCGDDVGWKPDPAPVEHALAALDATGGRAVMAGDAESDVAAARRAGVDAVHVERHGADRRGRCVLADYRVGSFADLAGG